VAEVLEGLEELDTCKFSAKHAAYHADLVERLEALKGKYKNSSLDLSDMALMCILIDGIF
jgi:hypothetical protein